MRFSDPRPRRPRRSLPIVEGLETRELMSTTSPSAGVGRAADLVNSPLIQKFANLLYGPNSATPMTPSPPALKRQLFTAAWVGQYTVGEPLFSDRASTIHAYAVSGGSNQFLKGKLNLVLYHAGRSVGDAHSGRPVCQPGDGHRRVVSGEHSSVGQYARARSEQYARPRREPARAADAVNLDVRQ